MRAKVTERGQVTIPKSLRQKLGIRPGVLLDFKIQNGKLIAVKEEMDPVARVFGYLGKDIDTDEHVNKIRK